MDPLRSSHHRCRLTIRALSACPQLREPAVVPRRWERAMYARQEPCMYIPRLSFPWQGSCLLLAVLLWGVLPSGATVSAQGVALPGASQDLASQLQVLKPALSDSQRRIAASIRTAVQTMAQHGIATTRTQMEPRLRVSSSGEIEVYLHTSTLTPAVLDALRQHGVRVLRSEAQFGIVYATVPLDALEDIAALPFMLWIGPPSYSVRRTGSVTSEGDAA